jgi:SNARE protein
MAFLFLIVCGVIAIIVVKVSCIHVLHFGTNPEISFGVLFVAYNFCGCLLILQIVNPKNKSIRDIPGLAPPVASRKLLWSPGYDSPYDFVL